MQINVPLVIATLAHLAKMVTAAGILVSSEDVGCCEQFD